MLIPKNHLVLYLFLSTCSCLHSCDSCDSWFKVSHASRNDSTNPWPPRIAGWAFQFSKPRITRRTRIKCSQLSILSGARCWYLKIISCSICSRLLVPVFIRVIRVIRGSKSVLSFNARNRRLNPMGLVATFFRATVQFSFPFSANRGRAIRLQ